MYDHREVISNCTDFYNLLCCQTKTSCIPAEFGQTFCGDNGNTVFTLYRFMFAPGFELSITKCTVKEDFYLECKPVYRAVEFQTTFELTEGKPNNNPNFILQFNSTDEAPGYCRSGYRKGEYLTVEMIVLLQNLSCYVDVTSFTGMCYTKFQIPDSKASVLLSVVNQIIHSCFSGNRQMLYYQAKSLEMLSAIVPILTEKYAMRWSSIISSFSKEDVYAIMQADKIIKERYAELLPVKELAAMVYININKLKSGYKKLYGMTVHEAVTARKMEIAYRLIINEGCSVKDASLSVGYRNEGHFIELFRRYYNFTPGELQHKNVKKL